MFYEIRCIAQAVVNYWRPPLSLESSPGQDLYEAGLPTPRREAFGAEDALKPPLWQQTHAALLRSRLQHAQSEERLNLKLRPES